MTETKVIYNPSYTEEENKELHNFIETASDKDLIEGIYELIKMYPEKERMNKAMNQLIYEISERDRMQQQYDKLLECKREWNRYVESLIDYTNVLYVREKYEIYKANHKVKISAESFYEECMDEKSRDKRITGLSFEYVRKCLFAEGSLHGKRKPIEPSVYYDSLEDVSIEKANADNSLEKLGKDNLKYLLVMLLQFVDSVGNENKADVILTFMTRKYAGRSHKDKKELPVFTSELHTYEELKALCPLLLDEIKELKMEAEEQKETMNL